MRMNYSYKIKKLEANRAMKSIFGKRNIQVKIRKEEILDLIEKSRLKLYKKPTEEVKSQFQSCK